MKMSILIPTYNGSQTITRALQSILSQNFSDYEIIICDDGSTDNTVEIIKSFQDQRIKFFEFTQNVGYAKNLQRCFEKAFGDIIFLFSQDDILAQGALHKTYNAFLLADDIGAVTRPYFWFDQDIKKPVRAVLPLDKNQNTIVSIFDSAKIFNQVMWSSGQLSGLALKREFLKIPVGDESRTTGVRDECFTAHIYPFLDIFKNHQCVFLNDYTVAVSIPTSQSRTHAEIYDISPTESWMKMYRALLAEEKFKKPRAWGINQMAKNYVGLVQIRNYCKYRYTLREIWLMIKYRWQNLFSPQFWFFSLLCVLMPRFILRKLTDWYKTKINSRFLPEIKFDYKKNNKKIALFMLPPLTLGSGAEKYFIKLAANFREIGIFTDVVTMDERFYKRFARALHIFFSFTFFGRIDISGKETEEVIRKDLGKAAWIKASRKELKLILNKYEVIYSKNEIVDLVLLKLIGYKNLPPVIVGVHTPIYYPKAASLYAKLHNFLYQSLVYKWLLSGVACLHVSNELTKKLAEEKFKLPVHLIYYPFDMDEFKTGGEESAIEFDKNKINICFLGRLSEQKGLDELRNFIKKISGNDTVSQRISLNILARGDKKTEKEFEEYDQKYEWLRYFHHVENRFMASILKKQDLLISPARWETMPYNILEAQAAGLPVIAFNIPGPNDIIVDDETGWLVKNDGEFCNKIVEFTQQGNGILKEKIIQHIREKFNQDKIYDKIVKLLTLTRL